MQRLEPNLAPQELDSTLANDFCVRVAVQGIYEVSAHTNLPLASTKPSTLQAIILPLPLRADPLVFPFAAAVWISDQIWVVQAAACSLLWLAFVFFPCASVSGDDDTRVGPSEVGGYTKEESSVIFEDD